MRLTGIGAEVAARARDILHSVGELSDVARAASDTLAGRLRIGVIPTIAPYLLPGVLSALGRTYPALDLHIRETITPRLIEELGAGQLDAAIVALPVSEPALTEMPLFEETMVLVRSRDAAGEPSPSRETLHQMRLLLLEEGHCFRDQALAFCNMPGSAGRDGMDGSTLSTLVQMVGAGLGVTFIPEMAVPVETRSADVAVTRLEDPQPTRTVGMIWRNSNPLAWQLERIAEVVRATGAPKPDRRARRKRAG